MWNTIIMIIGIVQTIWDSLPGLSGIDDFLGIFAPGNVLNDFLTFFRGN